MVRPVAVLMARGDETLRLPPAQAMEIAEATALALRYNNGRGLTEGQRAAVVEKVYNRLVDKRPPARKIKTGK
jgi:hypothetical protein